MTFESAKVYIHNNKSRVVHKYIDERLKNKTDISIEEEGYRNIEKIKSREILTRKEFNEFISFLKNRKTELAGIVLYMHTEGETNLKNKLEQYYIKNKSLDFVVKSDQIQYIMTHTDLDNSTTSFMKWFMQKQHTLESEIHSTGEAVYRVNLVQLRVIDYDKAWNFVKEVSKGAYFEKQ